MTAQPSIRRMLSADWKQEWTDDGRQFVAVVLIALVALAVGYGAKTIATSSTRTVSSGGVSASIPTPWLYQPGAQDLLFTAVDPRNPGQRYSVSKASNGGTDTGSVADATWAQVRMLALFVLLGIGALFAWARAIDVLALGEDTASGLGIDVNRVTLGVYVAGALLAAGTVSAAGLVGFVGLLVPHLVRLAGARTHRVIISAAALAGAALVVLADLLARVARPPAELPLGAVTAIIGVPFFLALLRRLA